MFQRFTKPARRVLAIAQEEARILGLANVGSEHLLLGLLRETDGLAGQVLHELGVNVQAVRGQLAAATSPAADHTRRTLPLTAPAKGVLEKAVRQALSLGHDFIGTEHLLLGLLCVQESDGARILARADVSYEAARAEIALRGAHASKTQTTPVGPEDWSRAPLEHSRDPREAMLQRLARQRPAPEMSSVRILKERARTAGLAASLCAWAFVALSAAPVRGAVVARIGVDDHGATYPLAVEPLIEQGEKLTGSAESGEGEFGNSVALSPDGNTALIGAPDDSGGLGAAWVFTRSGSVWTQQGAKLTGRGEVGKGSFGDSVALSSGGRTALIGGGEDHNGAGAVWSFARSGSKWTQQGAKLTGGRGSGAAAFGTRVALSSEGDTALIGGPGYKSPGAWVFVRSRRSRWTQQGAKLTCRERSPSTDCANSLALSGRGNTALVGGGSAGGQLGAVWVFARSGSTWTQQGPKLTAAGEAGRGNFGEGLALSADGDTALIGAAMNEEPGRQRAGAVWLFTRSHSTWRQHSAKLTGRGASSENELFGVSVALSSAGTTALIGGEGDNNDVGAAWVFVN